MWLVRTQCANNHKRTNITRGEATIQLLKKFQISQLIRSANLQTNYKIRSNTRSQFAIAHDANDQVSALAELSEVEPRKGPTSENLAHPPHPLTLELTMAIIQTDTSPRPISVRFDKGGTLVLKS